MRNRKKSFSYRSFVSILMALCFLGLALSGVVMYVAPPCSVAEATGWTFTVLSKVQWSSLHQVMALIIVVLALFHLFVYNWKTFTCYFRHRKTRSMAKNELKEPTSLMFKIPREVYFATLAAIILYAGALTMVAPFGWLHDAHDLIKDSHRESVERTGRGLGGDLQQNVLREQQFDTLEIDRPRMEEFEAGTQDTVKHSDLHEERSREGRRLGQGDPQGRGMGGGQGDGRGFGQNDSLKQGEETQ